MLWLRGGEGTVHGRPRRQRWEVELGIARNRRSPRSPWAVGACRAPWIPSLTTARPRRQPLSARRSRQVMPETPAGVCRNNKNHEFSLSSPAPHGASQSVLGMAQMGTSSQYSHVIYVQACM